MKKPLLHFILLNGIGLCLDDHYTVTNTGGARAGNIMSIFSGNTVNFTEVTTNEIPSLNSTTGITFSMSADSTNALLQVSATTTGWEVRTIVRSI